jgi:hypothetical protein
VDPSASHNYAIRMASHNNLTTLVGLLLKDPRVDPTTYNNEPLIQAACKGNVETVKILLDDPRIDPSMPNNYPITNAAIYGRVEVVRLLLADDRVDADAAIRNAVSDVVPVLAADSRFGIESYRHVYTKHHFQFVRDFDLAVAAGYAVAFCAKEIRIAGAEGAGNAEKTAWGDVVEPLAKRLKASILG